MIAEFKATGMALSEKGMLIRAGYAEEADHIDVNMKLWRQELLKRCSSEGVDGSGSFRVSSGLAIYCKVMLRHSPCVHHLSIQALALTVTKPIKLFSFTFVKSGCLDLASARFGRCITCDIAKLRRKNASPGACAPPHRAQHSPLAGESSPRITSQIPARL